MRLGLIGRSKISNDRVPVVRGTPRQNRALRRAGVEIEDDGLRLLKRRGRQGKNVCRTFKGPIRDPLLWQETLEPLYKADNAGVAQW